ncbi:MAG: S8 family serine peptidase [Candidatus Rokuibacteriota bacterium]
MGKPRRRRMTARRRVGAQNVPTGSARTLVYVHGIGNKPIQSVLKCQWDNALFGFDLGERSRFAYWVNREFYPDPTTETCQTGDTVRLEDEPTGRSLNIKRHLESVALPDEVAQVTDDRRRHAVLLAIARGMQAGRRPAGPRGAGARGVTGKVLPLPSVLRDWITRKLTRAFLRDVNDYFFVPARREAMRESLLARIRAGGGPFVVIGHSQGSMIAYDVLHSLGDKVEVPLFVTIGSPLGITEVQDQIKRLTGQRALAVPAGVARWVNVADPLDPVALDPELRGEFDPAASVQDAPDVDNLDSPRHPHSATGYLKTPPVRDAVHDAILIGLFQPVADFVVTRDLVRDLENCPPEQRHPVLIELSEETPAGHAGPADLEATRSSVTAHVRRLTRASDEALRLEELRHFVAVNLSRAEVEALASDPALRTTKVRRVWRNAAKHALLDVSIHTVQAFTAHAGYRATGRDVAWAVLDTGVNADHPHFTRYRNVGPQYDCTRRGPLTAGVALDENGHGSHVAGIIAGSYSVGGPGGRTLAGMAPETRLHVYKVLDRRGNGEDAWIIKALDHIAETNRRAGRLVIHGVNLSLGGPFDQSVFGCGHSPLCQELRRLWRQGVVVVLAAGNEGFAVLQTLDGTVDANMDLSIGDPANLEEAIAVGSIHKQNPHTYGVSYFSSRGPTADGRQKPDLVAPGERIRSCRHRFKPGAASAEDLYVEMSGTSMAAPHVSGILASFLSMRREFTGEPDAVKKLLLGSCTDLARDRPQQGAGMPNLARMMLST